MIFFDGKRDSLHHILKTLDDFQKLSGLAMNKEKLALYTAGLNPSKTNSINSFGFLRGLLPFMYLGLPLMHKKLRNSEYSPLIVPYLRDLVLSLLELSLSREDCS